ncbi:MAG TPA: hypothetical protein VJA85_03735 [Candidatus Limnocylindria bacterium]|nr:hypothetical protein [Candidatus Limnocylindria bacterium]
MATGLSLALFFYLVSRRLDLPLSETGFSLTDEPAAGGVVQLPATRRGGPARGDETNLPRWLRPSVQAARFTTADDGPREHGD